MYKATIKCDHIRAEDFAEVLDKRLSQFKVWFYDGSVYASFKLISLTELHELTQKLAGVKVPCSAIKIEKVMRLWEILPRYYTKK